MGDINYIPVAVWPPEGDHPELQSPAPDKKGGGVVFDETSVTRQRSNSERATTTAGSALYFEQPGHFKPHDAVMDYAGDSEDMGTADSALLFELRTRNRELLRAVYREEERRKGVEKDLNKASERVRDESTTLQRRLNGAKEKNASLTKKLKERDKTIAEVRGELAGLKDKMQAEFKKSQTGWNIVSKNLALIQKMRKKDNDMKRLRMSDKMSRVLLERDAVSALEKLKPLEQKNIELLYENSLYKSRKSKLVKKMSELKKEVESQKNNAGRWEDAVRSADKQIEEKVDELSEMTLQIQILKEEKAELLQDLENTTNELQSTTEEFEQLRRNFDLLTEKERATSTNFDSLTDKNNKDTLKLSEVELENQHLQEELSNLRNQFEEEQKSKASLQTKHDSLLKRYSEMKEHSPMLENIPLTKKNKSALKLQKLKFEKEMGELAMEMPHLFSGRYISKLTLEST